MAEEMTYTLNLHAFEVGGLITVFDDLNEQEKTVLARVHRQLIYFAKDIEKATGVVKKLLPDGQLEITDKDGNRFTRPPLSWEIQGN